MKDIQVSIGSTGIKSFNYNNTFAAKPGEQMKLAVKTQIAVNLNPASPTVAMVLVKYEASEEEKKVIGLTIETMTPVSVSTFVDNLDEVIKKKYIGEVMIGVAEKIRMLSSIVGLSLTVPPVRLAYKDTQESLDSEIYTTKI